MRGIPGKGVVASLLAALVFCAVAGTAAAQEEYSDTFPPETGIRKGPKTKTDKRKARFEFGGSEPGVRFECKLDEGLIQGAWAPCSSPYTIRGLTRRSNYVFSVRAVDAAGNADPTPADRRWKITKKKRKRR